MKIELKFLEWNSGSLVIFWQSQWNLSASVKKYSILNMILHVIKTKFVFVSQFLNPV